MSAPGYCGSGGCTTYVLDNSAGSWKIIGTLTFAQSIQISSEMSNEYSDIEYTVRDYLKDFGDTKRRTCKYSGSTYRC